MSNSKPQMNSFNYTQQSKPRNDIFDYMKSSPMDVEVKYTQNLPNFDTVEPAIPVNQVEEDVFSMQTEQNKQEYVPIFKSTVSPFDLSKINLDK